MLVSSLFSITIFSVDGLITRELYTLTIKDSAEEVWNVTIQCDTSGDLNDYVTFGEAPDANDGPPEDIYDVVKPQYPLNPMFAHGLTTIFQVHMMHCFRITDSTPIALKSGI